MATDEQVSTERQGLLGHRASMSLSAAERRLSNTATAISPYAHCPLTTRASGSLVHRNDDHGWHGQAIHDMSVAELREAMSTGSVTATQAVSHFCTRIEQLNPRLNAVIEVNPDALAIAAQRDAERSEAQRSLGPLHGICVLLKDNIDTADKMLTTAGSLALVGSQPAADAALAARLRAAGAVILGKTNLSEWANFRSQNSRSGWSGRGGQTHNPHVLDRSPGGSSAGSAAAIAAGLATLAVGTETNGSIVCPASVCGVVGFKPTVSLVPGSGVIPLSTRQDAAGPIARSVADSAALLAVLAGTGHDYTGTARGIMPLRGRRVGVIAAAELGVQSPAGIAACKAAS
eukprot:SAG31_NODE_10959_length_1079_cov_0.871429_1_plen_345_part_01